MCRTVIRCCGKENFILVNKGSKNSVTSECGTCGKVVKVTVYGNNNNRVVYRYFKNKLSKKPYKKEYKKRG